MAGLALGVATGAPESPESWPKLLALAERADALGLHSIWLPEGHFRAGATPSPLLVLAAFAARTRRLRLATTSVLVSIHHPLRIAADVATLDRLSKGRVLLGLGRGFQPATFRAFGMQVAGKRDRFDEALDAMLRAWSGEPFALDGDHWVGQGESSLASGLVPIQRPHPPLVVAAFGPKGLRQAARRGLPYLASPLETLDTLDENYALWREHHQGEADPRAPQVPVMRTVFIAPDDDRARAVRDALEQDGLRMRATAGRTPPALARAADGRTEDRVIVGTRGEVADTIARYRERLGMDLLVARTEVPAATPAERTASLEALAELV